MSRRFLLLALALASVLAIATTSIASANEASAKPNKGTSSSCQISGPTGDVKHVIFLIFDNVHFLRDNPNVPSDVEQMPHLLNFIRNNGTLMTNDHTVLISHTANGILTNLTGMYSDRHGQSVSNSYRFFRPDGSTASSSSFKYWIDGTDSGNPAASPPLLPTDPNFNMVNADSGTPKNAPAPWVPYTEAGCDFGATALANVVLENNNAIAFRAGPTTLAAAASVGDTNIKVASTTGFTPGLPITIDTGANTETANISPVPGSVGTSGPAGTGINLAAPLTKAHAAGVTMYGPTATDPAGDMTKVFGEGSAEWNEGRASQIAPAGSAARNLAQTDFVGMAIHCSNASDSICAGNVNARPDQLPDEPGGYDDFSGLFGAKYVNPAINGGSATMPDLNGNTITDQFGQPGFPGFDGLFASTTLSYVAKMQESGIPVTYGYISDAHDQHGVAGEIHATRGPGEADYVQQLKNYDLAFEKFFNRLAADGINKSNTLFVFTVEEGDHFAGSQPTPAGCDGVNVPCHYSLVGEVNGNLSGLMAAHQGITTPFTVHADMAPTIYITGNPGRADAVTRNFGRALGNLSETNPYTGNSEQVAAALADPVEMKALHMITADPFRTPTLTMFAQPDWFLFTGAPNCTSPCVTVPTTPPTNTFAWNHGGIQPEIATTWAGIVGPGVENQGDNSGWADHTDVRPTMLDLTGLSDSYVHDGRVLTNILGKNAIPKELDEHKKTTSELGEVYKQLNAPFGSFAMNTLIASTRAIKSDSSGDATYTSIENSISSLTSQREALATLIRAALDGAAFRGTEIKEADAKAWIKQANALLAAAAALGAGS
jgi:hypothetical protein